MFFKPFHSKGGSMRYQNPGNMRTFFDLHCLDELKKSLEQFLSRPLVSGFSGIQQMDYVEPYDYFFIGEETSVEKILRIFHESRVKVVAKIFSGFFENSTTEREVHYQLGDFEEKDKENIRKILNIHLRKYLDILQAQLVEIQPEQ